MRVCGGGMSDVGLVVSGAERAPLGRGLCMVGRQRGRSGVRCQELMQAARNMISDASRRAIDGEVDLPKKNPEGNPARTGGAWGGVILRYPNAKGLVLSPA